MFPRSYHEAEKIQKKKMQESAFLVMFLKLSCISFRLFGYYIYSDITPSILFYQFVLF